MAAPVWATNDVPSATDFNEWLQNINWAYKTANESVTSSTTLQTDDQLNVAVQANSIYFVTVVIKYDGDPAGDLKVLFRCPTSATFSAIAVALTSTAASQSDNQNAPMVENTSTLWGCLGGTCVGMVTGTLVTSSTAGNFGLEWAQSTSNATATRVLAGSAMNLDRRS